MTDTINWGVPQKRTKKTEKYDFPVLTTNAITSEKGGNRRFTLNKAAMTALAIEGGTSTVNIGFKDKTIYIAQGDMFKVGKNCSFSDKKTYNYIVNLLSLNQSEDNEFALEIETAGTYKLVPFEFVTDMSKEEVAETIAANEKEEALNETGLDAESNNGLLPLSSATSEWE